MILCSFQYNIFNMQYFLVFLSFFSFHCSFAQSIAVDPILFIVDGSNSMYETIDEKSKIDIIRESLKEFIQEFPDDQQFGLAFFEHSSEYNCNEVVSKVPLSSTNKENFISELNKANPKDLSALKASNSDALSSLLRTKGKTSIILISDGVENCNVELCTVVDSIKSKNDLDFTLYTVGLDIEDTGSELMRCAARRGRGIFFDARYKTELIQSLRFIIQDQMNVQSGRIFITATRNGEPVKVLISLTNTTASTDPVSKLTEKQKTFIKLDTGVYNISVGMVDFQSLPNQYINEIMISDSAQELHFDFSSGVLEVLVTARNELHDAVISVLDSKTGHEVARGRSYDTKNKNPWKVELPIGQYSVQISSLNIRGDADSVKVTKNAVLIKNSDTTIVEHNYNQSLLSVKVLLNGQRCDAWVNIHNVETGERLIEGRTFKNERTNPREFNISPGKYEIRIEGIKVPGDPKEKLIIEIGPNETVERIVDWK